MAAFPKARSTSALAEWLLGRGGPPSADVLRASRLAAYAYTILPADHALRATLRADFFASLRRHHQIVNEVVPLLGAWHAAGIDVLLFKGFHLAELVYPVPGARFHGDVDLLVRPEHTRRAAEIARALGWYEVGARPRPRFSHNALILVRADGATMIDAHRLAVHAPLPLARVQRRITEAMWHESQPRRWQGIAIREPSPVDALLIGLILQRCWSAEQWQLKPFDIVDFRHLTSRCAVGRDALRTRARALGCDRTLALFTARCDPQADRFVLMPPSSVDRRRWNRAVFIERGLLGTAERRLAQAIRLPPRALVATMYMPALFRVHCVLRRYSGTWDVVRALTPAGRSAGVEKPDAAAPVHAAAQHERRRVVAGVDWAMRLAGRGAGVGPYGRCLVRALAIYSTLRRRGWPVVFVCGIRREGDKVVGHAWVEHNGRALWELREPHNRVTYQEVFRFPAASSGATVQH